LIISSPLFWHWGYSAIGRISTSVLALPLWHEGGRGRDKVAAGSGHESDLLGCVLEAHEVTRCRCR